MMNRWMVLLFGFLFSFSLEAQVPVFPLNSFPSKSKEVYQGFESIVAGTELDYPPVLQKGKLALQASASGDGIVFKTEPFPGRSEEKITFIWLASFNLIESEVYPTFELSINGKKYFSFEAMYSKSRLNWQIENGAYELAYVNTEELDENGNYLGYQFLSVPASDFEIGEPIEIAIKAKKVESNHHYIAYQNHLKSSIEVKALQMAKEIDASPVQAISILINQVGPKDTAVIYLDSKLILKSVVHPGQNQSIHWLPAVQKDEIHSLKVQLSSSGLIFEDREFILKKVKPFEVYLLPHSHVDIGFTHHQDTVEHMQWRNFEQGIRLAEKTQNYPEGSRYKWNVEVLWAVDGYLRNASEANRNAFIEAVKKGWIGLDALYGSELTGLQRPEELMHLTSFANKMERDYGISIQSAMITDVPGYAWGIVPALAESEVKYFSIGPNHMPHKAHGGYQVGHTFEAWGDVPFYWASPDGKDKVLFWMSRHGYSWFHDWLLGKIKRKGGLPIVEFLGELVEEDYPYDLVQIRYTLGDNSGPDPEMPDFVRHWNQTHIAPKLRIATTAEMFTAFEAKYKDQLPVHQGDFSPYWEDGAASSALETAMNRTTSERLVQAETLWAMLNPNAFPSKEFDEAWTNVLLFSEHTWGAVTSKSDPDTEFSKNQWEVKKSFAENAKRQTDELIERAFSTLNKSNENISSFLVVNTNSWPKSELVKLPESWIIAGNEVVDEFGNSYPTQLLKNGEWAFFAKDIPPLGASKFRLEKAENQQNYASSIGVSKNELSNSTIRIEIDTTSGLIKGLFQKGTSFNFIDSTDNYGFNEYWYTGKNAENPRKSKNPKISIKENGPLVASILIESEAPGANNFSREIILTEPSGSVEIVNTVDKKRVYEDENVRFSFPFHVPGGDTRIDLAWAIIEPEKDQLNGSNKNFFCAQHFVDISNSEKGITWANIDAPLVETGEMIGQEWMGDLKNEPWRKTWTPSQRLFSWVMNNVWFVNYKGHQEGKVKFRYVLEPHDKFNSSDAKKFGIGLTRPFLVIPVDSDTKPLESLFEIKGDKGIIVSTLKPIRGGGGYLIRLFNASEENARVEIYNKGKQVDKIFSSNQKERVGERVNGSLDFAPFEIRTFLIKD